MAMNDYFGQFTGHSLRGIALALCLLVFLPAGQAAAAVLAVVGDVQSLSDPPVSVVAGVTESDAGVIFFRERRNYELPTDVDVDIVDPGKVNGSLPLSPGTLPAGAWVDSYFLHADPATLDSSSVLGAPGTSYDPTSVLEYQGEDVVELLPDRHTVRIDWFSTIHVDQIRVITRGTPGFNYLGNFLHEVPYGGSTSPSTHVDHPFSNDQSGAFLFVTPIYHYVGTQLESPISIEKEVADPRWVIETTDGSDLPGHSWLAVLFADPSSDVYVHSATVANTIGNYTLLDHPDLNGDPNARILVEAREDGVVAPDGYLGVWYTGTQWSIFLQDSSSSMAVGATFNVLVLPDDGTSFVHTIAADDPLAGSVIDDPRLNGRGWVLPHITQVWNPDGGIGVYNDHPVSLTYDSFMERWRLRNTDFANPDHVWATPGSSYNIFVPPTPSFSIQHRPTPANSIDSLTFFEGELLDGTPAPILLETPNLSPRSGTGALNPRPTGVYLERALDPETWGIFNQDDTTDYPMDAVSNVFQLPMGLRTFVHEASARSIVSNWSVIEHATTRLRDRAFVFVTQQWAPGAAPTSGVYNDHNIGVWYDPTAEYWAVFNQDGSPMPEGASFNIFVAAPDDSYTYSRFVGPNDPAETAFVHVATLETLSGDTTTIDHELLNHQPDMQLMVTQRFGVPGSPGIFNDHPIAVDYDAGMGMWSIVNQDGADMPENAAFNVIPVPEPQGLWQLIAGLGLLAGLRRRNRS
jgi:hypothetical protein